MSTKRCSRCGEDKPATEEFFRKRGRSRPGHLFSYCKPCQKAIGAAYAKLHPEIFKRARRRLFEKDPERVRNYSRKYRALHPGAGRAVEANGRAKAINTSGRLSESDYDRMWTAQSGRCWYCGGKLQGGFHTDHRIPLTRGGTNHPENACLCCGSCNSKKGRKTEAEFRSGTRTCTTCKTEKPETREHYYPLYRSRALFRSVCIPCVSEYKRKLKET